MKKLTKILSAFIALAMAFVLATPVVAINTETTPNTNAHTITITNPKAGHTYDAYQVFSGDLADGKLTNVTWGSGVNGEALLTALQTDPSIGILFTDCETAEDVANVLSAENRTAEEIEDFANVVANHLTDTKATSASEAYNTETSLYEYEISVTGDGYYFVKEDVLPENTETESHAYTKYILQVVEDVEVATKADAPIINKKIEEVQGLVDANNGSIGDEVKYVLTSKVPNTSEYDTYFFIVHDTLSSGLTFNDNVTITVGDKTLVEDTDFTVTEENGNIEIVFINFKQYTTGLDITIIYTATINENAVIGTTGNPNIVYLEYSNNPNIDVTGENKPSEEDGNVTGETPEDTVITYVTAVELIKVNEEGTRLTGAEFTITGEKINKVKIVKEVFVEAEDGTYYQLKDGTYTETQPTDETTNSYASTEIKYTKTTTTVWNTETEKVSATATVGNDGVVQFIGLGEGTYTIEEILAPNGYNLLKDPIVITIDCEEPTVVSATTDECVWTETTGVATVNNGIITLTVVNKAGATLPETGGMGTTLIYIIGGIMVVGAAVLLFAKKRVETK